MAAALATLAALAALAPPAWADHNPPPPPVVDRVALAAPSYVAWRVAAPAGAVVGVEPEGARDDANVLYFPVWIARAGTLEVARFSFLGLWWGPASLAHVQAPPPVGTVVSLPSGGDGALPYAHYAGVAVPEDGEWVAVGMADSDGGLAGSVALRAGPGVRVLGRATGPAFLDREPDFDGKLNVQAGAAARAIADAWVERAVADGERLFAFYHGGTNTGILRMGYDGPDGAHDGAHYYQLDGAGPGAYRFRIDESVDAAEADGSAVVGDVRLVPPIYTVGAAVRMP